MWSAGSQSLCGGTTHIAAALPVPKMRIVGPAIGEGVLIPQDTPSGMLIAVTTASQLECVALDIPTVFFQPQYGLQLELMRYRRTTTSKQVITPRRRGQSDWVHPAHGGRSGNDQRGGDHFDQSGVPLNMLARPSEWSITTRNQVVNVTQGVAGRCIYVRPGRAFFVNGFGPSFDSNPTYIIGNASRANHRYAAIFRGLPGVWSANKFRFRYSVVDPDDPRGGRISGPMSPVIMAGSHIPPVIRITTHNASPEGYAWHWNPKFVGNAELQFFFARRQST